MVAVQLAGRLDVEIRVLVTGDSDAEVDDLLREADKILGTQKQQVSYIHLPGKQISDLVIATASSNSQVLLVNSNNSIVAGGQLWPYLEQLSLPVLIIREQTAKTSNA